MTNVEPVIEGWFTTDEQPALLGRHCRECGTYQFPPTAEWCPNPACTSESLDTVPLSRTGRVWSYTDARYQPPAPFVSRTDPYQPFAIAAVELDEERLDHPRAGSRRLRSGRPPGREPGGGGRRTPRLDGRHHQVGVALASHPIRRKVRQMSSDVAVLGVGMHPWGKWGRPFVSYGVAAARAALADAGVEWTDVDFIVGGETVRNGYGGYVAGSTLARALGWSGARVATCYAACASGSAAIEAARTRIMAGLLRPGPGGRGRHHAQGLPRPQRG